MTIEIPTDYKQVLRSVYDELIDFVMTPNMKALIEAMYNLPVKKRPEFVRQNIVNKEALSNHGIIVPDGILIERSSFGDGRPTLFAVKKYLPDGYDLAWENLNITFDQHYEDEKVSRDETAWKKPLPFPVQAALQALELEASEI